MAWELIIAGAIILAIGLILYEKWKAQIGYILGLIGIVVGAILLIAGIIFLVMAYVPNLILPLVS